MSRGVLERRELDVAGRRISYLTKGADGPVTLYLHGLGADAATTRPLASKVPGTSVLVDLPSHGHSADLGDTVDYPELVAIARAIAQQESVTQALGVSLGSAILQRWISTHEDLQRAVLFLPASVTTARPAGRLRTALAGSDADLDAYVARELPTEVARTPLAASWLADRRVALRRPGVAAYAGLLEQQPPVLDVAAAASSETELLAIGAEEDGIHPATAAREAVEIFGHGRAHVFAGAAPLWTARRELRQLISGFLGHFDTV